MITVKEEFLASHKVRRAVKIGGYDVLALWLAMKGYAAQHLNDGFVPDDAIEDLPGAPKSVRKALKALVDCGLTQSDGSRGAGLVDEVPHGWQLHDYLDHALSGDELTRRRQVDKARKERWRSRHLERSGNVPENVPHNINENVTQNVTERYGNGAPRTRDPNPTQPNPTQ